MIGWLRKPRDPRHRLGVWGEGQAVKRLRREGFRILARNWQGKSGEIDLIAERAGIVHFVEVKTRTGDAFGSPEEAVEREKQGRLRKAAWEYLNRYRLPPDGMSFDIVSVLPALGDGKPEIHWLPGAF